MDGNDLLRDPIGLLAHYTALVEEYSTDPDDPYDAPLRRCGFAFLSTATDAALRPLVKTHRFARRVSLRHLGRLAAANQYDSDPIPGASTQVGPWRLLTDTGRNWPTQGVTPEHTVGGGRAVVVDWTGSDEVTVADYADGQIVVSVDLTDGPDSVVMGTDPRGYRAAAADLPWGPTSDPRAVALAIAARLTGEVLDAAFFGGSHRRVTLGYPPIDESDLLRDFHDYAAAHEPALSAIVADTACGPESTRQIAVQSAIAQVHHAGVADHPVLVEALHVLTTAAPLRGDPAWNRRLLDLIEPKAAYVRENSGTGEQAPRTGWFEIVDEVDAWEAVAAAFEPDPYQAAAHAWIRSSSDGWYLPGTEVYADDHIRKEILLRCLYRARDSGRYKI